MTLKKPAKPLGSPPEDLPASSAGDVLAAFPSLLEQLLCSKWDDGSVRATSILKLEQADGRWKLTLVDRAGGLVLYISNPLLEEAMLQLEEGLKTGKAEWQRDHWAAKRRK